MTLLTMYLSILTILFLAPFLSRAVHESTYHHYKINYMFTFMRIFWPVAAVILVLFLLNVGMEELAARRWKNRGGK